MQEILAIGVTRMRMSPEEVLVSATVNGAWAVGLGKTHGTLEVGKAADVVVYDATDYRELSYWFGKNLAATVFKGGKVVHSVLELRA
jgi:imidazolonepropionase